MNQSYETGSLDSYKKYKMFENILIIFSVHHGFGSLLFCKSYFKFVYPQSLKVKILKLLFHQNFFFQILFSSKVLKLKYFNYFFI